MWRSRVEHRARRGGCPRARPRSGAAPSAEELAERARLPKETRTSGAPRFLGEPPGPPPSLDGLPPTMARGMRAIGAAIDALFVGADIRGGSATVRGIGVGAGSYTG